MSEESTRLKRFIRDQEEAVQLARTTPEASNQIKVDALNGALSLAHSNAHEGVSISVEQLLKDAAAIERYLKED